MGKTTTVVNLGASLAHVHKKRVLALDLDPQANATRSLLGRDLEEHALSVSDLFLADPHRPVDPSGLLVSTQVKGLDLIPATIALSEAELKLAQRPHREFLLRNALQPLLGPYDYVLIDCPPSLGLLSLNGLAAAESVIVPVETQYLALLGLRHVWDVLALVRERLNPGLRCMGVLATKYNGWSLANREVLGYILAQKDRMPIFNTVIPRDVRAEEAPNQGLPLLLYSPDSRASQEYLRLAQEVIDHGQA